MVVSATEFAGFVSFALWPFLRVAALIGTAPVFSSDMVPVRIRLMVALVVTAMVLPVLPQTATADPLSAAGVLISAQQVLIGVAMGFTLRLVFSALTVAGQTVATSMGLGFASTVDPQNGVQVPVVSQLYVILATLLFLVFNGHLLLIEMVADSFRSMPVAIDGLTRNGLWELVSWGSEMFAGAMLIAMPVVASILLLNLSFGVITRAAPQLNIFAVGFPLTILMGFIVLWLTLPGIVAQFEQLLRDGFELNARLVNPGT